MSAYSEERLQAAIAQARLRAQRIGTMHAAWDAIFDGEALLQGKQTLLNGSREELLQILTDMLEKFS